MNMLPAVFRFSRRTLPIWALRIQLKPSNPISAEECKSRFRQRGITFTDWAKENGYTRNEVYRVLNGQAKCYYGRAHEIAVKLGLKSDEERLAA